MIKKFLWVLLYAAVVILAAVLSPSAEAAKWTKFDYVGDHCQGKSEFRVLDGSRVDCLTNVHAVKYVFAEEWAEGIGQALHFAAMTGKKPGIVIILDPASKHQYMARLMRALDMIFCVEIDIWIIPTRF